MLKVPAPSLLLAAQCALILAALAGFALRPPPVGRMLILPLPGVEDGAAVRLATRGGAALIGTGPLPGSVVVEGDQARLGDAVLAAGLVMLAAPRAGCGTGIAA